MHDRGVLHKRVMRWGDRYCVILSEKELQEHALHAGDEVDLELTPCNSGVDWEALPHMVAKSTNGQ